MRLPLPLYPLALLASLAGFAAPAQAQAVRVLSPGVVRDAPSRGATSLGNCLVGQEFARLSATSRWVEIAYDGRSAWVPAQTLAASQTAVWEVSATWLNLRRRPGLRENVLGGLPTGSLVVPVESIGSWRRIAYGGTSGWLHGNYLQRRTANSSLYRRLLTRARDEGASLDHLLLLDRGLAASPLASQVEQFPGRLASDSPKIRTPGSAFPDMGAFPRSIDEHALDFLHPWIKQACVVVLEFGDTVTANWYGRRPFELDQCWSATKHLQAINLIVSANTASPGVDLDDASIREAGSSGAGIGLSGLLRSIVSYEDGVGRSNAAAATLGRFLRTETRETALEESTGLLPHMRGRYGMPELVRRPELIGPDGRTVLRAPAQPGPSGPNLVSTYHLLRPLVMATWHLKLSPGQRLPGAQWASLEGLVRAMGHDSARYVDVGLEELGWARFRSSVVVSKLGFGIRSATGLPEIAYVATVQVEDTRQTPPRRRAFGISLRATHSDAVALDARVGAAVADVVRRVVEGTLR